MCTLRPHINKIHITFDWRGGMKERKEHIFLLRPSFLFIPNQKENDSQDRVVMADLTICVFSFPFLFLSSPYVSPYIVKRFQRLSPFLELMHHLYIWYKLLRPKALNPCFYKFPIYHKVHVNLLPLILKVSCHMSFS